MHLSGKYISALCLLVTGIYAQAGPSGSDTGNTLCLGSCADTPEEAGCQGAAVATFREKKQCWLCCLNDDHLDDFADHMDDVLPRRAGHE
ncbi:hypothetical protein P168DRAFT_319506 [Aspergillus campestris IBT 28561]|uniref:Uncharacterized protein n=1 Tax=Aspergillus campestris (strain IBT 28561) TaxID=1392248 RepID=A0A2I1CZD8_ASPC2|nr:uncharacterized protein P168DRAFT_319506 [Aspergillus campestris IBT 28561]PKY02961.1 hypothetical protein P168DRAFT_319506 [Aspergillus campestris IBT 28561]